MVGVVILCLCLLMARVFLWFWVLCGLGFICCVSRFWILLMVVVYIGRFVVVAMLFGL